MFFADCDYDSDCGFGLVCFRRGLGDPGGIPGCDGDAMTFGTGGEDYCISPPTENTLVIVYDFEDDIGTYPVGRCQGDCDTGKYLLLKFFCWILTVHLTKSCYLIFLRR